MKLPLSRAMLVGASVSLLALFLQPAPARAAETAKDTFQNLCTPCHGADGRGTSVGKSLNAPDFHSGVLKKFTNAQLRDVINDGKNNMPPFKGKLTDAQIDGLIKYVRALGAKK